MMKRRSFVETTVAAGLLAHPLSAALSQSPPLPRTPRDYEGPYYPRGPRQPSNDLVIGSPREPVLKLAGQVVDVNGEPIGRALVDIWQTDPLGRYRHPRDRSPGARWDDFAYWGESQADDVGQFQFRTYVPGAYAPRPAHIHYKVWHRREELLTSQIYFAERGGTQGASRNPRRASLQTVTLEKLDDATLSAFLRVVI